MESKQLDLIDAGCPNGEDMGHRWFLPLILVALSLMGCNLISDTAADFDETSPSDVAGVLQLTPTDWEDTGTVISAEDLCPGMEMSFVTNQDVLQTPDLNEPLVRTPFQDSLFGACLVRVTDREVDLAPNDPSPGLKNEYSRVQAFNTDGRFFLARGVEATWYVYDGGTLKPLFKLPFEGPVDPRWAVADPTLIYYNDETRLIAYDLQTGQDSIVHDFAGDFPENSIISVSTRHEGSPSADGRYWGFTAFDEEWQAVALLVYDQELDQVIAQRAVEDAPELDSVTISPLGNYFLAYFDYCKSGLGDDSRPCGLMVYDRNLAQGRGLLRVIGHSDVALDANGREVLIYQDIDTDHIAMLDLGSGEVTPLWPIDFSHSAIGLHFSGRALDRPGWALISSYNGSYPEDATWLDDQVFALELKPQGRIVRLAHTHSLVDEEQEHDYWAEPQATASEDFSRILFTSNWGRSGSGEVEMFMILLPEDWLDFLP